VGHLRWEKACPAPVGGESRGRTDSPYDFGSRTGPTGGLLRAQYAPTPTGWDDSTDESHCGLRRYMAGFCRSSVAASKHAGKRALRVRLTFRKPMGYWCIYNAVQRYDGRRRRAAAAHHW